VTTNRVQIVEQNLDAYLREAKPAARLLAPDDAIRPGSTLIARAALGIFEDQALSRALDVAARELKKTNRSFYTISSAGHEQNAAVGTLLRLTDPCFLHYRSGALMAARSRKRPGATFAFDTLLSLCASRDDPVCEGRQKVWGSREMWVPPQTSTIASHLPKAVGMAFAHTRARRLNLHTELPPDAIVCCSFGDASVNHATALAGINGARYAHRRGSPVPILFLCEDNGIGISVDTPRRWIVESFGQLSHLRYFLATGEMDDIWKTTGEAVDACRRSRGPVFLHLPCVRLWGHAGSDVETGYRSMEEILQIEAQDPLLRNAHRLVETGAATPDQLTEILRQTRARVLAAADEAAGRRRLSTRTEVMEPLALYDEERCRASASGTNAAGARRDLFGELPENAKAPSRRTLAAFINAALADEMARRPEMIVFGEDVGKKGGVYNVTAGLQKKFGRARVFDTLLDETTILGVAQGAALAALLPVPEIQYLAYLHNAIDQLRGEACSLSFFSAGQFQNPMVVRIAAFAYQKGFGGHFHNDNAIGALRDIPGLVLAAPARGDDAARMLRGCLALARECGRVVCFLEPIALYHEKDLYAEDDGGWLFDYPPPGDYLLPGEVGLYGEDSRDVLLVSYANGLRLALRAARTLSKEHAVAARVLDLRWLNPLPFDAVREHARPCERVVVVDECRQTGGVAEALIADLAEAGFRGALKSVTAADSYVPLGPSTSAVLVGENDIVEAVLEVCG
jgi:2-oxoisovalerate dehydrogenase E1 component